MPRPNSLTWIIIADRIFKHWCTSLVYRLHVVTENKIHCCFFTVDCGSSCWPDKNSVISVVPYSASWIHSCEHSQDPLFDWATRFTTGANQMLHVMLTLILNKNTHFCACASAETQKVHRTCDNQKNATKVCEIKLEEETRKGEKN